MSGGIRISQSQNPATWFYSIDQNGNSRAYYPGIVDWDGDVAVTGYTNVAELQATNVPALLTLIQTKGYYTEGDGGGAVYLRSGATAPGAVQSADGSWWRIVPNNNEVNPFQFGCRANGTDDSAAFLAALSYGYPVNGRGKVYTFATPVTAPAGFVGLFDASFQWRDTTAMGQQAYLLNFLDLDNFFLDQLSFNIGNRQNCGSADDSSRGGLRVTSSNPGVIFNDNVRVTNIESYGDGNGTRIYIRNCKNSFFDKLHSRNGIAAFTPDPTNDCINGIDISICYDCQIGQIQAHDFQVVLATVPTYQFSRAILFFELNRVDIGGTLSYNCAQGVDLSGAIVSYAPNGNNYLSWASGVAYNCYDWGFKFANVARNIRASNLIAFNFGRSGFVFSGQSSAPSAGFSTQRITLENCMARNPSRAGGIGFRALTQGADPGYPRDIRLVNCQSLEDNGNGFLDYSFYSDVVYDGASKQFNEISGCRGSGALIAFNSGWVTYSCKVNGTGSVSLANASLTDIPWDAEVYDPAAMHSTTVQPELIRPPIPGLWRVNATGYFAANATGIRKIDVLVNGAVVSGGSVTMNATSSDVAALSVSVDLKLLATDTVRIQAYQNSGGPLNFNRTLAGLSISLIEAF